MEEPTGKVRKHSHKHGAKSSSKSKRVDGQSTRLAKETEHEEKVPEIMGSNSFEQ